MNTLVYSAVDTLLLRPLPYPDAYRLAIVWAGNTREPDDHGGVAPADFLDWRNRATTFAGLAAAAGTLVNLSGTPSPERLQAARVSPSFFADVLQVQPLLGRFFTKASKTRYELRRGPASTGEPIFRQLEPGCIVASTN